MLAEVALDKSFTRVVGTTVTFFARDQNVLVNDAMISMLSRETEFFGRNGRICLHPSPTSLQHDMIVLEKRGSYFPPHRHFGKVETLNAMRGYLAVFIFDSDGNVMNASVLGLYSHIIRIGQNQWHLTVPLSDEVIYHESKPGPFLGKDDRVFANWAPRDDAEGVMYSLGLVERFKFKGAA